MSKNLVIVESPSKSKTIEKYLGKIIKFFQRKDKLRVYQPVVNSE
jgi:DNA topoisomerase IA